MACTPTHLMNVPFVNVPFDRKPISPTTESGSFARTPLTTPRTITPRNAPQLLWSPSGMCTPQTSKVESDLLRQVNEEVVRVNAASRHLWPPSVTQLSDTLFIGGFPDCETVSCLLQEGVSHVINCCSKEEVSVDVERQFTRSWRIAADDTPDYYILFHHLADFTEMLEEVEQSGGKVFVHCIAGVNRSATLCAAYLMQKYHIDVLEVVHLFRRQGRPLILENPSFRKQLVEHHFSLFPESSNH